MLAAKYIGVPIAPLAEQYSLIPEARGRLKSRGRLKYCIEKIKPTMTFAADGGPFGDALKMEVFDNIDKLVSNNIPAGAASFADMVRDSDHADLEKAAATIGSETLAKILFTSGSTGNPKGVPQSQRMLTVNQAQYLACLPMLGERPPVVVDWLPWIMFSPAIQPST